MKHLCYTTLCLLVLAVTSAAQGDWPQFRGAQAAGGGTARFNAKDRGIGLARDAVR